MVTVMSIISLALLSFLSHLIILTAQPNHTCFNDQGTYQSSSAYHTNLNTLLSDFTTGTKIDEYGFYNSSYGEHPDTVYASGLCRGDVKPDPCRSCLKNATSLLPGVCPNQKKAFGYYEFCYLRYSSRPMFGIYEDPDFNVSFNNPQNAENGENYRKALDDLMKSLKTKAAAGDSRRKVAMGNATADQSETVYGLAQCTPDLSQRDCDACLEKAISDIPGCCQNKIGGRVIKLSCNLRFEKVQFYNPTVLSSASPAPAPAPSGNTTSSPGSADSPMASSPSEGNKNRATRIVMIVAALIGVFITLF